MNQVLVVFWAKMRMARHEVASVREQSKLKVGVITVFATALWFSALLLFWLGFRWVVRFGGEVSAQQIDIGSIIMARMLGILALAIFFMLIFSNILVAFSTLYRSREVAYLLQGPISYRAFFVARFWECLGFSSWAVAFLGSPLMLAYGFASGAAWPFYPVALVFFLPFVTIPAAMGALIAMILARVFPRQKVRVMIGLGIIAVGLLFIYLQDVLNATRLSQDAVLEAVMDATAQTQSPFLPSVWASRGILAAGDRLYGESLFQFCLLLSTALMAVWATAEVAQRIYYAGYSFLAGQDRTRIRPLGVGVLGRLDHWLRWMPNPARSLVVKDIKLF
ncbi:MAG: hypothetical protein QG656_2405, partial [Candidatus Hydrogenedentes bacterium]|nr:hypothetical protein [Candidatus Hydrogenedentota bacterium]